MKHFSSILFIAILGFILSSCDPGYQAEWKIVNRTNDNIEIRAVYEDFSDRPDSSFNSLSPQSSLIVFDEFGIGEASDILNSRDLPFMSLTVINAAGQATTKNVLDRENWNGRLLDDSIVLFEIILFPNDF